MKLNLNHETTEAHEKFRAAHVSQESELDSFPHSKYSRRRELKRIDIFYQVFGFVAAICIGIIALTTFFTTVGYFKSRTCGFDIVKLKRFIKDGRVVNVHLNNGKVFPGVRFVGFTDQNSAKGGIPYSLSQMVVCETAKGARIFFRAEAVRVIEEAENPVSPGSET